MTTRTFPPEPRPVQMKMLLLVAMSTAAMSAQGLPIECEALLRGLTAQQQATFRLARQACAAKPSPPDGLPAADDSRPRAEAAQLQLYDADTLANAVLAATVPTPPAGRGMGTWARPVLKLANEVAAVAQRHDIDPLLLHAIAHVESRHNAAAVSRAGALGVLQVMPDTARRFGVTDRAALRDARTNLEVGASYLKVLQQRFGNDLPLVLAAYNAGEGAVERHGRRIPPFKETQAYVRDVLARYDALLADMRPAGLRGAR